MSSPYFSTLSKWWGIVRQGLCDEELMKTISDMPAMSYNCPLLISVTCPSGEELSDTGCKKCAIGYYRDETLSRTCQPCPSGKITEDVGAISAAACFVGMSFPLLTLRNTFKMILFDYRNVPKFSDRQVWANSADPDQTAPGQGLHCLQFPLHLLDALL